MAVTMGDFGRWAGRIRLKPAPAFLEARRHAVAGLRAECCCPRKNNRVHAIDSVPRGQQVCLARSGPPPATHPRHDGPVGESPWRPCRTTHALLPDLCRTSVIRFFAPACHMSGLVLFISCNPSHKVSRHCANKGFFMFRHFPTPPVRALHALALAGLAAGRLRAGQDNVTSTAEAAARPPRPPKTLKARHAATLSWTRGHGRCGQPAGGRGRPEVMPHGATPLMPQLPFMPCWALSNRKRLAASVPARSMVYYDRAKDTRSLFFDAANAPASTRRAFHQDGDDGFIAPGNRAGRSACRDGRASTRRRMTRWHGRLAAISRPPDPTGRRRL